MSSWHEFLKSVNQELKVSNPEMSYTDRIQIASQRWKDKKTDKLNAPVDYNNVEIILNGLQEEHLRKEPTEDTIDNVMGAIMKLKGKEFDDYFRSLSWVNVAKILTIVIGQPDLKFACRFIKRLIPIVPLYTYEVFYHKTKDDNKGVDLLFWCLYNLRESSAMPSLLDALVSMIPNTPVHPVYATMGMRTLYDMDNIMEMKTGEKLSSSILVGKYLQNIPLETLEKLIRQMTTKAMFLNTDYEPSFSEVFWKSMTNFSFAFTLVNRSKIIHHLLLNDRFIVSPVTIKLLSILGEEGEKIANKVFIAKQSESLTMSEPLTISAPLTMGEQYCLYLMEKYKEENFYTAVEQTALTLCFPTRQYTTKEEILQEFRNRKTMYDQAMRKIAILSEDYFDKKINEVFFSTQEEISIHSLCFQTSDNCLFGIDELPYLKKKGLNPFTNTKLTDEDMNRINNIISIQRPVLEVITETSSMYCDLRLLKQNRNSHLDSMMNKSIFLGYATKFSVALDKIFTSNIILNSVMMYMYEPYMLNPRSEMTDYRQGLYPLGRFLSLNDETIVRNYWTKASNPTGLYEERRKNFTWMLIFLMEMYGQIAVNLFAYVVENFVVCLP